MDYKRNEIKTRSFTLENEYRINMERTQRKFYEYGTATSNFNTATAYTGYTASRNSKRFSR